MLHPNLKVTRFEGQEKIRYSFLIAGMSTSKQLRVWNRSVTNLVNAINERVFYVRKNGVLTEPPKPLSEKHVNDTLRSFKRTLARYIIPTSPLDIGDYVQCYDGRKRTIYTKAMLSLEEYPLDIRVDGENGVFVKGTEKTDQTGLVTAMFYDRKDTTKVKIPRVITSPNPRYLVSLGPYIRKIEHDLMRAIQKVYSGPTIMKGLNADEVGERMYAMWCEFDDPIAIGLDAERFDQHVSIPLLRWEFSNYQKFYPGDRNLLRLLSVQLYPSGRGYEPDGCAKFKTKGTRTSGVPNTGIGNCLLMCAMVWSLFKKLNIRHRLANNGDDCVIFMNRSDEQLLRSQISSYFIDLGFSVVLEPTVDVFEKVVFCQAQPIKLRHGYRMCRQLIPAIAKDSMCVQSIQSRKEYEAWLAAVAEGGQHLTSGIPIFQHFYNSFLRASNNEKPHYSVDMKSGARFRLARGLSGNFQVPTDETRMSFYHAFDILPDDQVQIEKYFDTLTPSFQAIIHDDEHMNHGHNWEML